MKAIKSLLCISCLCLIFAGCSKKSSESERSVRIAIQPSAAFVPLYAVRYNLALEKALSTKNVKVIWQDFESGPPMNESLAAELSDIGVIGDVPTVLALTNETKMRLVGIPARGPNAYAVIAKRSNNSINSYKDFKGKRIATVFGSTGHNFTKKLLEKGGLTFSDIEFSNISASTAEYVLASDEADAVVIWEPNVTRLVDSGLAKIVSQGDETNLRGTNGFVVREDYLNENSDVIQIILDEYGKAARSLPSMNDSIMKKIASVLKIDQKELLTICSKYDYSAKIQVEDIKSLQDTIKFLLSIGNLSKEYNVKDCVNMEYASR